MINDLDNQGSILDVLHGNIENEALVIDRCERRVTH